MNTNNYKKIIFLCIFFLIISIINVSAKNNIKKRPKIGLVLSGGGAKGIAHVGVLKVLEEAGIKVDYITGTSMGSIVGALYASGYNAKMLEKLALELDWDDLLSDSISRADVPIDEKDDHDKYIASFPLKRWSIELPKGLIKGQKLTSTLSTLTLHVQHIQDFKQLPIPFLCIATNIETGKAVVLDKGYLPDALRASMAIPSVFTPIEIDGQLLIDGGVVRNLPVTDAKKMGADIIIAVDVGAPLYKKDEISSIAEIMDQSVSFLGVNSTAKQRKLCNILIIPDIKGFNGSNFDKAETLIKNGEKAAREQLPELKKIAALQNESSLDKRPIPISAIKKLYIIDIKIYGLKDVSENLVLGNLLITAPDKITSKELEKAINRVYASNFFDRVTYQIEPAKDKNGKNGFNLIIRVVENTATFLKVGLSYDSDMKAAVLLNSTFRNILGQGSKLSLDARLSENPGFKGSYFIHSGWRMPGIGLGTSFEYNLFDIYTYESGNVAASYKYSNYDANIIMQTILFNYVALGGGIQKEYTSVISKIDPTNDIRKRDIEAMNYYGYLIVDTLDRTFYPRKGVKMYGEAKYITDYLSIKKTDKFKPFMKYMVKTIGYVSLHKKLSIFLGCSGGSMKAHEPYRISLNYLGVPTALKRKIPFTYLNYLGGFNTYKKDYFPFTGLNFMQISAKNVMAIQLGIQFEPWHDKFIILRGNIGKAKNDFKKLFDKKAFLYGYGLTIGMNSLIGPIEFTLMRGSEKNRFLININIGFRI